MASSIDNENNYEHGISAIDEDTSGMSFGLHALGELHAHQHEAVSEAPNVVLEGTGVVSEVGDGPGEAKNLQAALDWYKDWLGSI